jgi:PHP family Zn ribbon phosphoesterase
MRKVRADLHLHTCLSPCADMQMQATAIVEQAKKVGLDVIAICDHNSADNAAAVVKAGQREALPVIPGIEITSSEEVHILGLFRTEQDLMCVQEVVYENLPGENCEEAFGPQTIIDEWDNTVGTNHKEKVIEISHQWSGLAIASHVDRERFSLIGQLGFIPEGLSLDALEVSKPSLSKQVYDFPVVSSSDAHFLDDIGKKYTDFLMEDASVDEIEKALRSEMGRKIVAN